MRIVYILVTKFLLTSGPSPFIIKFVVNFHEPCYRVRHLEASGGKEEIVVHDKEGGFALNTTTLATCPLDERYGDSWEGIIREIIQMFPLEREICCFTVSKFNINKAGDK